MPRSIITNDADEAARFFATCPGGVICKPMLMGSHYIGGEHHVAYTRTVAPGEFDALKASIALCPTYLQEKIIKEHELRVTIIGDKVFTCRIDSQGDRGRRGGLASGRHPQAAAYDGDVAGRRSNRRFAIISARAACCSVPST